MSDWQITNGRLDLKVTIPANTTATVYVPVTDPATVKEGGKDVTDAAGAKFLRVEDRHTLFEVGSGTYHFTAPL